jgi:glucose dehydrogenase
VPAAADINDPGSSAPGEWLTYGGSYNSQRYSPLKQVNTANAGKLQMKWVHHVAGSHELEMTPVVLAFLTRQGKPSARAAE